MDFSTGKPRNGYFSPNKYGGKTDSQNDWGGFIDVRVDDASKEAFHAWESEHGDDVWVWLMDTQLAGLKFGLSWDAENNCTIATLTGAGVIASPKRFCLTARGKDWRDASALLCFKHYVMLESDWGNFRPATRRANNWG